jgi:uncharacterized protein YeaO (DUF488 family)
LESRTSEPLHSDEVRTLAENDQAKALDALAEEARRGPVTLVFGARDAEHNQARVIAAELERRLG